MPPARCATSGRAASTDPRCRPRTAPILPPGANFVARLLQPYLDRAHLAVALRIGGVVAEQVVRAGVGGDAAKAIGHFTRLRHHAAGVLGELTQRLARAHRPHAHAGRAAAAPAEAAGEFGSKRGRKQAAAVSHDRNRIERHVRRPRQPRQLAEFRVEVRVEEPLPFRLAQPVVHVGRLRSTWIRPFTRPIFGGSISTPSSALAAIGRRAAQPAGDEEDARAVLTDLPEELDEPFEQRVSLVGADAPAQHLVAAVPEHDAVSSGAGAASSGRRGPFDLHEPPAEKDVLPGVLGRDQSQQIARLDFAPQERAQRLSRRDPPGGVENATFQDDDDDAVARVGRELEPFARGEARRQFIVRRPRVGPDEPTSRSSAACRLRRSGIRRVVSPSTMRPSMEG